MKPNSLIFLNYLSCPLQSHEPSTANSTPGSALELSAIHSNSTIPGSKVATQTTHRANQSHGPLSTRRTTRETSFYSASNHHQTPCQRRKKKKKSLIASTKVITSTTAYPSRYTAQPPSPFATRSSTTSPPPPLMISDGHPLP